MSFLDSMAAMLCEKDDTYKLGAITHFSPIDTSPIKIDLLWIQVSLLIDRFVFLRTVIATLFKRETFSTSKRS